MGFHLCLLVLLLLGLQEQLVGLVRLGLEVLVLREQKLELDGGLVEEHTGDGWSELFSIGSVDGLVNVVSDEVVPVVAGQTLELADVNLWKLHHLLRSYLLLHLLLLLLLHHDLLLRRLLAHLLLGRLLSHLLLAWLHAAHLHVVLVVLSTHLTIVVVLPALVVVATLLVVLVSTSGLLHVAASSSVATAASVLVSLTATVVLVLVILEVSLHWAVVTTMHDAWSTLVESGTVLPVLILDLVDELRHVVDVFVSHGILSFVLGLPEVHFERFHLFWEKPSDLIKELNCLLCLLHTFVEDVADLVLWRHGTKFIDFVVLQPDGNDVSSLLENLFDLLFAGVERDEFDVEVRLEHFLLILLDLTAFLQFTFLLVDVGRNKDSLAVNLSLHVGCLEGFLGRFMILETNETLPFFCLVHGHRVDVSVVLE